MLSRLLDPENGTPRDRVFWLVLTVLVSSQLLAFYMLCSHQVRKAEVRQAAAEVQRLATSDCLEYLAQSTIGSCVMPYGSAALVPNPAQIAYR